MPAGQMAGKLSAVKVRNLAAPGRYGDGGNLWLQVRSPTQKSWIFRFTIAGKARLMGLGDVQSVSLAEAREAAEFARRLLRQGIDPLDHRRTERARIAAGQSAITFKDVAKLYIAAHEAGWRNAKHRYQWRQTLDVAAASFGDKAVTAVTTADVVQLLEPIWTSKTETASRLRGRIEAVLDYAKARGWREGENPARWRGHLSNLLPRPSRLARVVHHPALPSQRIGAFMVDLRAEDGIAARALEFTILTAARTGEVIGARWSEIDLEGGTWTVPGERMKAGREHRVPLTEPAVAVLRAVLPLRNQKHGDWIFPSTRLRKPLSNMAMTALLRRMKREDITVHGFRSTFRDWAAENTAHSREVAEAALAHVLADKVEAAYRRGDLFEKRRRLMEDWAKNCGTVETDPA